MSGTNPSADRSVEPESAAQQFDTAWSTLVDVLGAAATAALFRRAAKNAKQRRGDLAELGDFDILREQFDYRVVLPESWKDGNAAASRALRYLLREELYPLLEELTGPVVVRLLETELEL